MNPNINYYGIVILLRKLRECGIFTEKELRKIAARRAAEGGGTDRRGQRRGHYDFSLISFIFQ